MPTEQIMKPLNDFLAGFVDFIPSILTGLSILVIGVIASIVLGKIFAFVLKRIGVESALNAIGADQMLEKFSYPNGSAVLLGSIVRWTGFLMTMIVFANAIGFEELSSGLTQIIAYLPKVVVACLFILIGVWAAELVQRLIIGLADSESGLDSVEFLAQGAYYAIIVITAAISAEQLGLPTELINGLILILGGAIALAGAIAMGIGSRETSRNFIARNYAKNQFQKGDYITVKERFSGIVRELTTTHLVVKTKDGDITVPYHLLMNEIIWLDSSTGPDSPPTDTSPPPAPGDNP